MIEVRRASPIRAFSHRAASARRKGALGPATIVDRPHHDAAGRGMSSTAPMALPLRAHHVVAMTLVPPTVLHLLRGDLKGGTISWPSTILLFHHVAKETTAPPRPAVARDAIRPLHLVTAVILHHRPRTAAPVAAAVKGALAVLAINRHLRRPKGAVSDARLLRHVAKATTPNPLLDFARKIVEADSDQALLAAALAVAKWHQILSDLPIPSSKPSTARRVISIAEPTNWPIACAARGQPKIVTSFAKGWPMPLPSNLTCAKSAAS